MFELDHKKHYGHTSFDNLRLKNSHPDKKKALNQIPRSVHYVHFTDKKNPRPM
jgi:hypothetical protein